MTQPQVIEKLLQPDKNLLKSLRLQYLTLREEENLAGKVLEDIVVVRSKDRPELKIKYILPKL